MVLERAGSEKWFCHYSPHHHFFSQTYQLCNIRSKNLIELEGHPLTMLSRDHFNKNNTSQDILHFLSLSSVPVPGCVWEPCCSSYTGLVWALGVVFRVCAAARNGNRLNRLFPECHSAGPSLLTSPPSRWAVTGSVLIHSHRSHTPDTPVPPEGKTPLTFSLLFLVLLLK